MKRFFGLLFIIYISLFTSLAHATEKQWYDCLDRNECLEIAESYKSKLAKKYARDAAEKMILSELLAEYLRDSGTPIELSVIGKALESGSQTGMELVSILVKRDDEQRKVDIDELLRGKFVPFIALREVVADIEAGRIAEAKPMLDELAKRYKKDPQVTTLWGRSKMEEGDFGKKVYKRLESSERTPAVVSQMIRYLDHYSKDKEIEALITSINLSGLSGADGSQLMTELARRELNKKKTENAEAFLKKALQLFPTNTEAQKLMAYFYMND